MHFSLSQQATLNGQKVADRAHKYDRPRILCSCYQFTNHICRHMNGIDPEQKNVADMPLPGRKADFKARWSSAMGAAANGMAFTGAA
jgi:hypothetical protein